MIGGSRDFDHSFSTTILACKPISKGMTSTDDLKAAIFQRLHPRVYFERFVAEKVRPDGRDFHEWREVSVNVGVSARYLKRTHLNR